MAFLLGFVTIVFVSMANGFQPNIANDRSFCQDNPQVYDWVSCKDSGDGNDDGGDD